MLLSVRSWQIFQAVSARSVFVILIGLGGCGSQLDGGMETFPEESEKPRGGRGEVVGHAIGRPGLPLSIITLSPHIPRDVPVPDEPVEMDQYGRAFFPRLLAIREGQTVLFRNSENEMHNVNVTNEDGIAMFNIGMPFLGGTYLHTFDRAGDYAVACNVHQEMSATIIVTDRSFVAATDREGHFVIPNVPYGVYELEIRRGTERSRRLVDVDETRTDVIIGAE